MKYPPYDRYYDMQTMWFGVIPFNWKTTNFRNILIGISDGTHGTHQRTITGKPLLSAKNVFNDSIKISENESRISEEEYKLIIAKGYPKKGDLLVTCVGTLGRSIVYPYEEPLAFQRSVAFLRLEKEYDSKYFKYLIESKGYQDFLVNTANVSAQGGIYMGDLAASEIVLPSLAEQTKIAKFLDYTTAQIDQLIEKKKALIEKLNEQRIAIITQAVTKGLNPNAPMKDSGVDWLGEVPAHWEVKRLKFCCSYNDESLQNDTSADYAINYVDISGVNHTEGIIAIDSMTFDKAPSRARRIVREGDIIISTVRTYLKAIASVSGKAKDLIVSTGFAVIRNKKEINKKLLSYCLLSESFIDTVVAYSKGVSYPATNASDLVTIPIVFPAEQKEQNNIVQYLNIKLEKIDHLIKKKKTLIEKLKEYRTALITAAVTGKIDVRGFDINKHKTSTTTKKRESSDAG